MPGKQTQNVSWQVETKLEREARGRPTGRDVPYAAMGGLTGFSSLLDGYLALEAGGSGELHMHSRYVITEFLSATENRNREVSCGACNACAPYRLPGIIRFLSSSGILCVLVIQPLSRCVCNSCTKGEESSCQGHVRAAKSSTVFVLHLQGLDLIKSEVCCKNMSPFGLDMSPRLHL